MGEINDPYLFPKTGEAIAKSGAACAKPPATVVPSSTPDIDPDGHLFVSVAFAFKMPEMVADMRIMSVWGKDEADATRIMDAVNLQDHPTADGWAGHMVRAARVEDQVILQAANLLQKTGVVPFLCSQPPQQPVVENISQNDVSFTGGAGTAAVLPNDPIVAGSSDNIQFSGF